MADFSGPGRRGLRIAFAATLALWTVALLVPVSAEDVADDVPGGETTVFFLGKALHVGAYTFLTAFAGLLLVPSRRRPLLVLGLAAHGGVTEFLQQFVGRGSSWRDWALDCAGVALGLVLTWRWWNAPDAGGRA